jgi:hypothetical protein
VGVGSFPHRPHFLRWHRAALEPRPPVVIVRQVAVAPWSEESFTHGEYGLELTDLIDIIEFSLVVLFGFMPLTVIHWSHRQRRKRDVPPLPRPVWWAAVTAKLTLLIAAVTNWMPKL